MFNDQLVIGLIGILMIVHLGIGVPLFLVLGLGSLAMIGVTGVYSIDIVGNVPFTAIDSWALLAMPLFILTGDIISGGKIATALTDLGEALLGWMRGGLGMTTIGGCFLLSGTSGSNSADTAAIGKIMIPSMVKSGYDRSYAAALAAGGGCLGIIVPPSLIFIIYGVVTSTSVGDLFLAGILPGMVMAAFMCTANYLVCRNMKWGVQSTTPFSGRRVIQTAWGARYGLLAPVLILSGIYSGIFTPTESAAVAVAYCLFAELFITRGLKWSDVPKLFTRSGIITGMIGPIIAFSILFGEALSVLRVPDTAAQFMLSADLGLIGTILMVMLLLIIFGCFMETIASIIILMPILMPIAAALNIDMVHFGVFIVCTLTIGFITPPVGINLFAASAVSGVPYMQIAARIWPLFLALVLAAIVVAFVPGLSLWFR